MLWFWNKNFLNKLTNNNVINIEYKIKEPINEELSG